MSAEILIEGAAPNSIIAPGERRRVQATSLVRSLLRGGFARIIHEAPAPATPAEEPAVDPAPKRRRRTSAPQVRTIEPAEADDPEAVV